LNLYIENKIDYKEKIKTENVLDKWILSRLNNLVLSSEKLLEEYNIGGACREIEFLVEDLSKWYIRRSRRRFQKPDDENDFNDVVFVLGYSLLQLSKIIAPFTPFFAEGLYQSLKKRIKNYDFKLSVHLESWPKFDKGLNNKELEEKMETVRIIASEVLAIREKEKIKVRQPLQSLKINNKELEGEDELLEILKDEINIKEIKIDGSLKEIKLN
jgi:isoleucyl-tRNA synthetase